MKRNYDKKHNEKIYEPGHLVAVWTPVRKIGKCEKLLRKYFGPYRILKKLSNVNYLIEPKDNPGQDPLIVHVSRLKPYFERIDELRLQRHEVLRLAEFWGEFQVDTLVYLTGRRLGSKLRLFLQSLGAPLHSGLVRRRWNSRLSGNRLDTAPFALPFCRRFRWPLSLVADEDEAIILQRER
ncbi:hypothetical protein LAZ67_13000093 [Cordylochernes scorpioides]|uniref:Integrase p58-like C-terminal domain-containing protein n=1 Tax=Cordylochernes scorpioides TaxID=51811 RepID=A0ABY6L2M4_9ARAC|nr:hypothetical protein LAZ67_13000093 [Cordylochernes scorpioides]